MIVLALTLMGLRAAAQLNSPKYEETDCPVFVGQLEEERGANISCGYLIVTEDRDSLDNDRLIELFVVRIAERQRVGNAPLLYLAGGPGDAASSEIAWWLNSDLRNFHDIILIDQRGSGRSKPSLNCPELDESAEEDGLTKCRDRLVAAGIDPAAYNTEAVVMDVVDFIVALQLETVYVYGESYGTRLAQILAQRIPERIGAMVLDGIIPPGVRAVEDAATNTERALQRVVADCSADPACHGAYPQLQGQLENAVSILDAAPLEIVGLLPDASLRLNGADFAHYLREMLADSTRVPYIPALIAAIAESNRRVVTVPADLRYERDSGGVDSHSEGLYHSIICAGDAAHTTAQQISARVERLPTMYGPLATSAIELLADCEDWTGERATGELTTNAAVDIPTLVLSGRYDPITAARGGLDHLSRSWTFEFPQLGHGVLRHSVCAQAVTQVFLSEPAKEPRHDCLLELRPPEFYVLQSD